MRLQKLGAIATMVLACLLLSACQSSPEANSPTPTPQTSSSSEPEASPTVEPTAAPTAQPTPTATPADNSSKNETSSTSSDNSCFEGSAFVGNSMLEDLNMYGIIDNADFYAKTGLTVTSVFEETTVDGTSPIMDEVIAGGYKKVFLMFGLNELGWSYSDVFVEDYGKIIDALQEADPNVEIYLQSLFPVSKARSDKNLYGVTNQRIVEYNSMLKELAEEKGVHYVDVYSSMVTEDGTLPDSASPDGVHPNMDYCKTWVQYLRDHC